MYESLCMIFECMSLCEFCVSLNLDLFVFFPDLPDFCQCEINYATQQLIRHYLELSSSTVNS